MMRYGKIYCDCGHESGAHISFFDKNIGWCRLCPSSGSSHEFEESLESVIYNIRINERMQQGAIYTAQEEENEVD